MDRSAISQVALWTPPPSGCTLLPTFWRDKANNTGNSEVTLASPSVFSYPHFKSSVPSSLGALNYNAHMKSELVVSGEKGNSFKQI